MSEQSTALRSDSTGGLNDGDCAAARRQPHKNGRQWPESTSPTITTTTTTARRRRRRHADDDDGTTTTTHKRDTPPRTERNAEWRARRTRRRQGGGASEHTQKKTAQSSRRADGGRAKCTGRAKHTQHTQHTERCARTGSGDHRRADARAAAHPGGARDATRRLGGASRSGPRAIRRQQRRVRRRRLVDV